MNAIPHAERLCPDCHVALLQRGFQALTLDVCPECAGIWFDGGEFDRLSALGPNVLTELDTEAQPAVRRLPDVITERWCPACPEPLERCHFAANSPIEMDTCPRCRGAWICDGDLARIQQWVQLQKLPKFTCAARSAEDLALELAECTQEHQAFMQRAHALTTFLGAVGRRRNGLYW